MGTTALCIYRVRPGKEDEFKKLLVRHWNTLSQLGLVESGPPVTFQGEEKSGGEPLFVELLPWRDEQAPARAHELPEVAALWEPMGELCESRGGRPPFEFPHVRPLALYD